MISYKQQQGVTLSKKRKEEKEKIYVYYKNH